jgi:hypothetical protein
VVGERGGGEGTDSSLRFVRNIGRVVVAQGEELAHDAQDEAPVVRRRWRAADKVRDEEGLGVVLAVAVGPIGE